MVDRVEISIIEAAQPRWLTFLGGKIDQLECTRHVRTYQLVDSVDRENILGEIDPDIENGP